MFNRALWFVAAQACFVGLAALCGQAQEAKSEPAKAEHAPAAAEPGHAAAAHAPAGATHEHAAAHGPEDTDLSHGNASARLPKPEDVRFDLSIYTFLVFVILLAILYKFAWGPISTALDQREETIARQIEEARLASDRAALQLKEYEARLATATDEARQIVANARKDAEVAKDKIVAEAREAAGRERDRAIADIGIAKNQALDAIAQKSVQTAVSLASQIIRREVKPNDHEALIGDAINEFSKLN